MSKNWERYRGRKGKVRRITFGDYRVKEVCKRIKDLVLFVLHQQQEQKCRKLTEKKGKTKRIIGSREKKSRRQTPRQRLEKEPGYQIGVRKILPNQKKG